jgi:hypothetical protein
MTEASRGKQQKQGTVAGSYAKGWQAAVDYLEGSAQAAAHGFRSFQSQLDLKDLLDVGAESGLVGALLSGYASYFDGMAKVAHDVSQKFRAGGTKSQASEH